MKERMTNISMIKQQ